MGMFVHAYIYAACILVCVLDVCVCVCMCMNDQIRTSYCLQASILVVQVI